LLFDAKPEITWCRAYTAEADEKNWQGFLYRHLLTGVTEVEIGDALVLKSI